MRYRRQAAQQTKLISLWSILLHRLWMLHKFFFPRIGSTPRATLPRPHAGINLPIAGGSGSGGAGGATSAAGIVDINSATLSDLDALPGVGPSTAQAIIDYRVANGPYASVDDLLNVRGIGPSKLAAMRARVRV